MKTILFTLLFCCSLYTANAQLLQLQDPVSSKNFNPEKYAGIRGTPFLQDKWVHGAVTTNLGIYNDLELKIDLYDNVLFYNNGGEPFELIDKIVEVKYNEVISKKTSDVKSLFLPVFVDVRFDKDIANTLKELV